MISVNRLRELGVVEYNLWLPETGYLEEALLPNEELLGLVYGRYTEGHNDDRVGRGVLIATNRRIILLDKKPMYLKSEDITYQQIQMMSYVKSGLGGTVTVKTEVITVKLRSFNQNCARQFMKAAENRLFEIMESTAQRPVLAKLETREQVQAALR